MARSVGWRRECNDVVYRRIEEALEVTLYIVHQTGPTGFVVKEEGRAKKLKVCTRVYTTNACANLIICKLHVRLFTN